jgi:phosphatidylserine/phosphatidylglycerophosphate/cardiolipin synthase-like enzyme
MYTFFDKPGYFAEITKRIRRCGTGNRILIMSMMFEPDQPGTGELFDALLTAAKAGSEIVVGVDARNFMDSNHRSDTPWHRPSKLGPLWFHHDLPDELHPPYEARARILERLNSYHNVHAVILNRPSHRFSITFAGRSHIKAAVIDDHIYVGGCNLDYPEFIDMMIGFEKKQVADELYDLLSRAVKRGNIRLGLFDKDRSIRIDDESMILVDAGRRGRSIIYGHAIGLIGQARRWVLITSQFFPNGRTAQNLLAARERGVDVTIRFSHWSKFGIVGTPIELFSRSIEFIRLPNEMFAGQLPADMPYLHAKLLATDQGVMIGSHNYVTAGTDFGTAEIAFHSTDAKLAKQARQKLESQIMQIGSQLS